MRSASASARSSRRIVARWRPHPGSAVLIACMCMFEIATCGDAKNHPQSSYFPLTHPPHVASCWLGGYGDLHHREGGLLVPHPDG